MNSDVLTVKPFTAAPPLSPPVDASETRLRRTRTQNIPFKLCGFLFADRPLLVPVVRNGSGLRVWVVRGGLGDERGWTLSPSDKGKKEISARKIQNAIHLEVGFIKLVAALMCFPPTSDLRILLKTQIGPTQRVIYKVNYHTVTGFLSDGYVRIAG
jgi:hypothetical protein